MTSVESCRTHIQKFLNRGIIPETKDLTQDGDDSYFNDIVQHRWLKHHLLQSKNLLELIGTSPEIIKIRCLSSDQDVQFPYSLEDWETMILILTMRAKKNFHYQSPFISFNQQIDGLDYRFTCLHHSLSSSRCSKIFVRRHHFFDLDWENFGLTKQHIDLVQKIVQEGDNFLISGSTASGKTSFLTKCLSLISDHQHLVTIEDIQEIPLIKPFCTQLITSEDHKTSLTDLISHAMRMSPEKIAVGELRGREAIAYLMLMNTGHQGVYSTLHSNHGVDALHRLAQMVSLYTDFKNVDYHSILRMIAANVRYVFHLKNKKLHSLIKVINFVDGQIIYENVI